MSSLKKRAQSLLKQAGIYERLRASWVYDLYWRVADTRIIDERREEVDFYRDLLCGSKEGDLIFDVGANHGRKTDVFLRLGARVIAVEPDQLNQKILAEKFLMYRFSKKPVTIVGKAVSDSNSTQTMWVDAPGSAKNTLSQKWVSTLREDKARFGTTLDFAEKKEVETVTLEELIAVYGKPFFIKIDVEGHEPSVLRGLRQPVPFISFEVNLPEFRPEGLQCLDILEGIDPNGTFNYSVDCSSGQSLKQWLEASDFTKIFNQCTEGSIEVLWRSSGSTWKS